MVTYILLFVLYGYDGSISTISQEFSSAETCEFAGTFTLKNIVKFHTVDVISQGCFKK